MPTELHRRKISEVSSVARAGVFRVDARAAVTRRDDMKLGMRTLGIVLIAVGLIWFLQGIGVLPGSFMTGQIRWAVYGGIAIAVGVVLLVLAHRQRQNRNERRAS